MQVKTCPAMIKAAGTHEGTDEGGFEAIVATYDVDSVGDRIVPGAFAKTLTEWRESGDPIPVVWSHKSDDPNYHVGYVLEAEERPEGLWVKAKIDTDAPTAAQVYRLLKGRRIRQFSFAYDEVDARPSEKAATGADKDLHELKVYEVGPTMIGANQRTNLLTVKQDPSTRPCSCQHETPAEPAPVAEKAAEPEQTAEKIAEAATDLKAGRALSRQNEERVAQIARLASELLAAVRAEAEEGSAGESGAPSNAEKAAPSTPAATKESPVAEQAAPEAEGEQPADSGVADERLRAEIEFLDLELHAL